MEFIGSVTAGESGFASGLSLAADWKLLTVPFLLPVLSLVFVVIHETGHLVIARLLGIVPTRLSIGRGDIKRTVELGSLDLTIRTRLLGGGMLELGMVQGKPHRWRMALVLLAGVGAEALFWVVVFLPRLSFESISVGRPVPTLSTSLSLVALVIVVLHVAINLTPHDSGGLSTDGKQLLQLARGVEPAATKMYCFLQNDGLGMVQGSNELRVPRELTRTRSGVCS